MWCARLQGQEDPPLNARGTLQATALAGALQGEPIERIYTSDLRRALHTAQAVASALGRGQDAVVALPSLRERHLGILQARCARQPLMLAPVAAGNEWPEGDSPVRSRASPERRQLPVSRRRTPRWCPLMQHPLRLAAKASASCAAAALQVPQCQGFLYTDGDMGSAGPGRSAGKLCVRGLSSLCNDPVCQFTIKLTTNQLLGEHAFLQPAACLWLRRINANHAEVERLAAAHPGDTLLLVAHGGVLQCLFERAAGRRPPDGGVPNGALGRIRVEGTRYVLGPRMV